MIKELLCDSEHIALLISVRPWNQEQSKYSFIQQNNCCKYICIYNMGNPPTFYAFLPSVRGALSVLLDGRGTVCRVDAEDVGDLPMAWSQNMVMIASTPDILGSLLPNGKLHLLAGDPFQAPHFSSKGLLFSATCAPQVASQVVCMKQSFEGSEDQLETLDLLLENKLHGICSDDPESWSRAFRERLCRPLRGVSETGFSLITFDLDGVLVESKELHYDAFNCALLEAGPEYVLERTEHDAIYCGLSTKQKLRMLTVNKGLPPEQHDFVWTRKQYHTLELMKSSVHPDHRIIEVIRTLRGAGYPVAVASNCIRDSVFYLLHGIGVHDDISCYFSNEDVSFAKPDPEIYIAAAEHFGVRPDEMLVVEDSAHGKQAALLSGAHLCPVGSPADVDIDYLSAALTSKLYSMPTLNIVIPMAGPESQFIDGTTTPTFMLDIGGAPLLERVVANLQCRRPHRFIFIARKYQARTYKLADMCVKACNYQAMVLREAKARTCSALETALLARDLIDCEEPVLFANMNMWPEFNEEVNVDILAQVNSDCLLTHFASDRDSLSYITLDAHGCVTALSTKARSSTLATTGYTFFAKGSTFIGLCEQLLGSSGGGDTLYMEDAVKAALGQRQAVSSVAVDCIPLRCDVDLEALRARFLDSTHTRCHK